MVSENLHPVTKDVLQDVYDAVWELRADLRQARLGTPHAGVDNRFLTEIERDLADLQVKLQRRAGLR